MTDETNQPWICGFWRRIGAALVDTLLLGALGFALGLVFESLFVQLGSLGRLIGFSIALIYFGIGNSHVAGGQTLGKRLLKIRVVDANNSSIALGKSALRYVLLATPFYLNGFTPSESNLLSVMVYPLSLIVFGGSLAILYLYIFNRVTRQSLHDVIMGTFVVNAHAEAQEPGSVWKPHFAVVGLLMLGALLLPVLTTQLAQDGTFENLLKARTALLQEHDVSDVAISTSTSFSGSGDGGTQSTAYVAAQVSLKTNKLGDADLARQLATTLVASYPDALNKDVLQIKLAYGYDIGIWSQWAYYEYNFEPGEFRATVY